MSDQFNIYVAERTRQQEEISRAENYRLVRQAEKGRQNPSIFGKLLVRSGQALLGWGQRLQGQADRSQMIIHPH